MTPFKILHKDGKARVGQLKTAHGIIETPTFIPVGTQGAVKALSPREINEIGVQMILANTYHLMLRPGDQLIKKMGGLHEFMGWDGPIMTDSGGFQVFSLGVALEHEVGKLLKEHDSGELRMVNESQRPRLNKITEEGVIFQSHLDGSKHILTPERSIQIQLNLGTDLIVAFDDLESPKHSYEETLKSLDLTERWEMRSLEAFRQLSSDRSKNVQIPLLYGVTHGGVFEDLRERSAKFVDKHFDGIALGGAHKDKKTLYQVVEWTQNNISDEKPRHLLGIGEIDDLFECIERGIDLFDCAAPTRRARNGSLYISPQSGGNKKNNFQFSILNSKFKTDPKPIDTQCNCYTCQNFSRAYIRHLFMAREILYFKLASYHNVYFITKLLGQIRNSIGNRQFGKLKKQYMDI